MKNSALYHTLPTIRKMRRQIRRTCQRATKEFGFSGCRSKLILKDDTDRNVLKSLRWRNRFMTTKNLSQIMS